MDRSVPAHSEGSPAEAGDAPRPPGGLAPLRPLSPAWVVISVAATLVFGAVAASALWLVASGEHSSHVDAIKTGLSIGAGGGGVIALWAAVQRLQLAQRKQIADEYALMANQAHAERVARATEADAVERRFTDLYVKAGDQLGSDKAAVRLTGLYALERLVEGYPAHRQMIVNVICAYLQMPFTPPSVSGTDPQVADSDRTDTGAREELRVRLAAQRILRHLLALVHRDENGDRTADADVDLSDAVLVDMNLDHCHIADADFSNAVFYGPASFGRASFSRIARFQDAEFHSKVSFIGTDFRAGVLFKGARFDGDVRFEEASLHRSWFDNAVFGASGNFRGTTFHHAVDFEHAEFHGPALFSAVTFDHSPGFGKVTFDAYCRFDDCAFRTGAVFSEAMFAGDATFVETTFGWRARFHRATFGSSAVFNGAVFKAGAEFDGATFHEQPAFLGVEFHGLTKFEDAEFRSDAGLEGATVHEGSDGLTFLSIWPPGWKAVTHPTRENVRYLAYETRGDDDPAP